MKHIVDPQGNLISALRELEPGQTVVLRLGEHEGLWRRFQGSHDGKKPEAFNCADDRAKTIWNNIPVDGCSVEISLVRIGSLDVTRKSRQSSRSYQSRLTLVVIDHQEAQVYRTEVHEIDHASTSLPFRRCRT